MTKRIVIVGAGPGGLTSGMLLAHRGCSVDIYEKNDRVGGRNQRLTAGPFSFDLGPTFLMLPEVLRDVFKFAGRDIDQLMDMKKIDPFYRLRFSGARDFYPTGDPDGMQAEIKRAFPGDEERYVQYMEREREKFDRIFGCLKLPYHRWSHLMRPKFVHALPMLDIGRTLYGQLSRYFGHDEMRIAMTFQSKYLGMSPWTCPAAFTILSYIEHSRGILHPIGGLNAISRAMADCIAEDGGRIHLNTAVQEIVVENGKAKGVVLEDGSRVEADAVIINADFAHGMTHLVKEKDRKKYTDANLNRRNYSCSTFMLYLGLDKRYDIPHHNVIFADDYRRNVAEIAETKTLSADPSFYIQNASVMDPTLAPDGKSTLYVLVPAPNNSSDIDWVKEKARYRRLILDKIMEKTELKDLEAHIEEEIVITPLDWEQKYGVYKGATFNLSHELTQMLVLRPHNLFEEFGNCYLVGGGTHPGSGLPTIYESGRISANLILQGDRLGSAFDYKDIFEGQ